MDPAGLAQVAGGGQRPPTASLSEPTGSRSNAAPAQVRFISLGVRMGCRCRLRVPCCALGLRHEAHEIAVAERGRTLAERGPGEGLVEAHGSPGVGTDERVELTRDLLEGRDEVPACPGRDEASWLERDLDRDLERVSSSGSPRRHRSSPCPSVVRELSGPVELPVSDVLRVDSRAASGLDRRARAPSGGGQEGVEARHEVSEGGS